MARQIFFFLGPLLQKFAHHWPRVSVFLWTLFPVSHCVLYTSWLSTQAFLLFSKSCTFIPEDGRIDRNM